MIDTAPLPDGVIGALALSADGKAAAVLLDPPARPA